MKKILLLVLSVFLSSIVTFAQTKTTSRSRSAKTGRYVTESHAKKNPSTTVTEKRSYQPKNSSTPKATTTKKKK